MSEVVVKSGVEEGVTVERREHQRVESRQTVLPFERKCVLATRIGLESYNCNDGG